MTNGEMIQKVFNCEVCEPIPEDDIIHVIFSDKSNSAIGFDLSWWDMEYKDLTTKNDLGVDCISRTRAIDRLKLNFPISQGADNSRDRHRYMQALADLQAIRELPSVTPIRPKGRWIDKQHLCGYCSAECSSCHKRSNGYVHDNGFSLEHKYYDFCPNCGAKMESEVRNELIK